MRRLGNGVRSAALAAAAAALGSALALAACAGTTATPSPTSSPTPEPCSADRVRAQVREMLAGRTFETHYLTINGQLTLSVWLVDPQIDAVAQTGLSAGNRQALETGLTLGYQIVHRVPCVTQVFENVNPMIVDGDYTSWYMDIIPARAFLGLEDPTAAQLVEAVSRSGAGPASGRLVPPRGASPAPSGSCTWLEARATLATSLGQEPDNTAAYVIVGGGIVAGSHAGGPSSDVAVQAQIQAGEESDTEDRVLMARLDAVARDLACLSPAVDQLELFVVDGSGRLVVYARVPGTLIGPDAGPLPPGMVLLHHIPAAGEPEAQDSGRPT